MKQMNGAKKENLLKYIAWISLALYFIFRLIMYIKDPSPKGDEKYFLEEIARFRSMSFRDAYFGNFYHLYLTIWYLISFLPINDLMLMRFINIVIGVVNLCLMYKILNRFDLSKNVRSLALLTAGYAIFVSQSGTMHYSAINDPIMNALGLATILFLIRYLDNYRMKDLVFTAVFSGMMFWIRTFSIIIFGGIIAAVFMVPLLKKEKVFIHLAKVALFLTVFVLVVLIIQVPSLIENQKITFEGKRREGLGNWSHRNWLTQKEQISSGSIFAYKRVEWEYVDDYIETYGKQSIPSGVIGVFKDNPKLKTDITVVNLFFRIPYILLMSTGLMFLGLFRVIREPESWLVDLPPSVLALLAVLFSVCCGVSLAIINYIEHRWIFMAAMMGIGLGAYGIQSMTDKWQKYLVHGQYVLLMLLTVVSSIKNI